MTRRTVRTCSSIERLRMARSLSSSLELKEAFSLFDRIGGGVIRVRDLAFVMRSIGYQASQTELEQMIREVDRDGASETAVPLRLDRSHVVV